MIIDNDYYLHKKIRELLHIDNNTEIKCEKMKKNQLANDVYKLTINNKLYILKKYNYNYDFNLSKKLYEIYEKNKINVVKPINDRIINIDEKMYNIFEYIESKEGVINDSFIVKLIKINRKVEIHSNLLSKCDSYYNFLSNINYLKIKEAKDILKEYRKLKFIDLFNDKFINHGDLSKTNILFYNNVPYLIDFDEVVITTELYDFAVMIVKQRTINNTFNFKSIRRIIKQLDLKYTLDDYKKCIKMYLCKILLEKFYLYEKSQIDLFDKIQEKDSYTRYYKLLKNVDKI